MKTELILSFEPKAFDTASDMMVGLLVQFSKFLGERYLDLYYQTTFAFDGFSVHVNVPVVAPAQKKPAKAAAMPKEHDDDSDELLFNNNN